MNGKDEQQSAFLSLAISGIAILATQIIAFLASEKNQFFLQYISILIVSIQILVFLPCSGIFGNEPTERFYDFTGSVTYVTVLLISFFTSKEHSARQIIATITSIIWSIRLGWFLFTRIMKDKGIDERFANIKKSPLSFLVAWCLQGLWVFLTILGVLIIHQGPDEYPLKTINCLGIFLWLLGFSFEVIADMQKRAFRADPNNKGKWISNGLWSISRHPNYFGEITLWIGIALLCIQDFKMNKRIALLFISPLFVAFLLIFVSGIPILEKKADLRFGSNEEYKKYRENTAVLIPYIA